MKKNMGNEDRIVRVLLAIVFAVLYFGGIVPGAVGIGLCILGIIFVATSVAGFCPCYALFGISSCRTKPKEHHS